MTTIPELLARRLRHDPSQPLVSFYDDTTGERTELSVTTYANWVAKTANLFADELMLDPGEQVSVDLPAHWLGCVFLGAVWSAGLTLADAGTCDVHVVGPQARSLGGTTIACALRPFGVRYPEPLPADVQDFGILWPGQSDFFAPVEPTVLPHVEPSDERVLTDLNPLEERGRELWLGLLAGTGSLVLTVPAAGGTEDDRRWPARSESERATVTLRSDRS